MSIQAEKDKADMKASIDSVKIALMQALQDRDQRYLDKVIAVRVSYREAPTT